jgi:hypothetical protein
MGLILGFVGAWTARLELAVRALEDVPVRSGVAEVAVPEDQCRVGLDHLECVVARTRNGHVGVPRREPDDDCECRIKRQLERTVSTHRSVLEI